jgi:hypothetical protein
MGRRGGENMTKRKTYKYIIELSKPVWPRHLVDELLYKTGKVWDADLISVKDLQFGKHIYGDTYYANTLNPNTLKAMREKACFLEWLNDDGDRDE